MTFSPRDLSVLAYANGFTLWHYKAGGDLRAALAGAGFFDSAADLLATGDMLMITAPDGGKVVIASVDQGKVTLLNLG